LNISAYPPPVTHHEAVNIHSASRNHGAGLVWKPVACDNMENVFFIVGPVSAVVNVVPSPCLLRDEYSILCYGSP